MSVEQARNVTADFGAREFPAPPRTIADITAILDQQKPDETYRAAVQAKLKATPPVSASAADRSEFYGVRADTAMQAGLGIQAVDDARESVRLAREASGTESLARALGRLMVAELYVGGTGLEAAEEEYRLSRADGWTIQALLGTTQASLRQGDIAAAQRWVATSDAVFAVIRQRHLSPSQEADIRANVASAHAALELSVGKYAEAERSLRSSIDDLRTWSNSDTIDANPHSGLQRADYRLTGRVRGLTFVLVAQDRLVEAEVVAREFLLYSLRRTGRTSPTTAAAVGTLAFVLQNQGRFKDAERLILSEIETREALGIAASGAFIKTRDALEIPASAARDRLGDALAYQRRWPEAMSNFGKSYESLPHLMALYESGHVDEGLWIAKQIADARSRMLGVDHASTATARGFVGVGLALQGDRAAAQSMFRVALSRLRWTDVPSAQELQRYVFENHLRILTAQNRPTISDVAEAFQVADALRLAETDRAVSASVARATLPSPELADLARREQDAGQQISARQATLADAVSLPIEQQNAAALAAMRSDVERLKQARAVLTQEIGKRFPDYANLVSPPPASIEQARAVLTNDEALIALYAGEKESYVWALRKSGMVAFVVIPLRREQLADMVGELRRALDPHAQNLGEIPPFDVALAHRLYAAILEPVEAGWKGAKTLIVAPHGPLAQIPFSLLVTRPVPQPQDRAALFSGYQDVPFLLREVAVTQVPSVAALAILRGMPPVNPARRAFVGFGDPWFSAQQATQARAEQAQQASMATRSFQLRAAPATETMASANIASLPRLADTAEEVREVAVSLRADPAKDVFLGPAANEWQVRNMKLDDRRVVMFATHGLVPGDLDGLAQPALALSAPSVANVDGDGLLTMDKILGLKLDADWVVLSACNTAAGDGAGAEAVSGLGRAFFYAGARALLVTNWAVETTSARKLTTSVFARQAGNLSISRAEVLRQSMLSLIDGPGAVDEVSGRVLYSYSHPIFWAPFSLVGDGR
jgi:CHAT domain-containing protein